MLFNDNNIIKKFDYVRLMTKILFKPIKVHVFKIQTEFCDFSMLKLVYNAYVMTINQISSNLWQEFQF